jgi:hypothetical protein
LIFDLPSLFKTNNYEINLFKTLEVDFSNL